MVRDLLTILGTHERTEPSGTRQRLRAAGLGPRGGAPLRPAREGCAPRPFEQHFNESPRSSPSCSVLHKALSADEDLLHSASRNRVELAGRSRSALDIKHEWDADEVA